jgi:hypothetical protein
MKRACSGGTVQGSARPTSVGAAKPQAPTHSANAPTSTKYGL